MMAYRLVEWERPPEPVEIEVPRPQAGELLVRVAGNGLCHSDIAMSKVPASIGAMLGWQMPFTLGHEIGGWVEELGPGVTGLEPGDPVALVSPSSCGACSWCVRGQDSACPQGAVGRGYGRDGGLAPYVLVGSTRSVIKLGALDPMAAGPLTDAGATSYHAVRRVVPKLVPGSTAVVIGAGGLGGFAVQFLRAMTPARVVAVDTSDVRREVARELGAHVVLTGVDDSTTQQLHELTAGEGADAVLDFVGIDATMAAGLASVRKVGAFALVGAGGGTFSRPWFGALPNEADIFCFQGSSIADVRDVLALADRGLIRSEIDVFGFSRVEEAYAALDAGRLRGRAVVTPQE
jgi:alcohol dehydrogenase, propanol-preferring